MKAKPLSFFQRLPVIQRVFLLLVVKIEFQSCLFQEPSTYAHIIAWTTYILNLNYIFWESAFLCSIVQNIKNHKLTCYQQFNMNELKNGRYGVTHSL